MNSIDLTRMVGIALLAVLLTAAAPSNAQPGQTGPGRRTKLDEIKQIMSVDTAITLQQSQVSLRSFTYPVGNDLVEALMITPLDSGQYPGLLMIPGYMKTARDFIPLAVFFARQGFVTLSISQPGFGRSNGRPDFAGPRSVRAAGIALDSLKRMPLIDSSRLAALGYSRGAMVIGLLAAQRRDIDAAVLGAGIYDLGRAYHELKNDGIRRNIEIETGANPQAFHQRSLIGQADSLDCPVMIIHGDHDQNAPVIQAKMLKEELDRLAKDSELVIMKGRNHNLNMEEFRNTSLRFLQSHLSARAE